MRPAIPRIMFNEECRARYKTCKKAGCIKHAKDMHALYIDDLSEAEAIELKILEMFGGFSSALDDASANDGGGANGYWTGGNDLTNLASNDIITSDDTEFKWDFDQDVFWR